MSVKLSAAALAHMPAGIAVPNYRRSDLSAGIVHFGVGNFHRAHQAVYLDDLFNAGRDHDWAVVGAGVRDPDVMVREKLKEQDWLTTVVEQEAHATNIRVTGAMIDFVRPYDVAANLDMLARPQTRIVSLTVTEGGYYISPATQKFDSGHPDIVADARNIDAPKTVFGLIVAGLKRRRAAGVSPFTVMSCDNIPGNGHVTENAVAGVAELADPKLAQWIRKANVCFPNSMVDRITPATTDRERAILQRHIRPRGQLAGLLRSISPVGRGRQVQFGAPGAGDGRGHLHVGCRAVRTNEDSHPQRRSCGDRLSGGAARHPFRARGDGGPADPRNSSRH